MICSSTLTFVSVLGRPIVFPGWQFGVLQRWASITVLTVLLVISARWLSVGPSYQHFPFCPFAGFVFFEFSWAYQQASYESWLAQASADARQRKEEAYARMAEYSRKVYLSELILEFGPQADWVYSLSAEQLRFRILQARTARDVQVFTRSLRADPERRRDLITDVGFRRHDATHFARTGKRIFEHKVCVDDVLPMSGVRNVSGKVKSWLPDVPVGPPEESSVSAEVEEHTLGGEFLEQLNRVKQLCNQNAELALVDASLTFVATVFMSNGTWPATLLASKEFVKNIAMFMPAQRFIQATLASVEAAKPSPDADVFDQFEVETPSPVLELDPAELEKYVRMACKWDKPGGLQRRYFDGNLSEKPFAEATYWKRNFDMRFVRLYGFDSHNKRSWEFARECKEYPDLAKFVDAEDTLRDDNVSTLEIMAGVNRARSMGHLIIGNAIVVALGGILSVNLLKTHAPVLAEIAFNLMGPGKDFAKLVKSVCGLLKDSAVYFAYVITGNVTLLRLVEDPLTSALVTQDRLESDMRDKRGDQSRLLQLIEEHTSQVSMRHGRMRSATTPADAAPWGQLLLRAFHLRDDARRRRGSKTKMESLLFTAEGPVGSGKTVAFTEWAERIVSAVLDESAPDDGSFGDVFMQSDPKFYDGIVVGQKVIGYDDAWGHIRTAPPGDPSVKVFLQMISQAVVTAPMSDVKDKGEVPLTPAFVFVVENQFDDALGKFTAIVSAVRRRSQLHFKFQYRDGLKPGDTVDYKKDVIVTLQRYLTPRTNDFVLGKMEDIMTGSIDEVMEYAVKVAEAYGRAERHKMKVRTMDGVCRTCRRPGCQLGAGVPRELHFDEKFRAEVDKLWTPKKQELAEEPQEIPDQVVAVSAIVAVPLIYVLYWAVRSVRMAWHVQDLRDDRPQTWGQWFGIFLAVPLAWTVGWSAFAVFLPLHVLACLLFQNETGYFVWAPWLEVKGKLIAVMMFGDKLVRRYAPWVTARYLMARVAMGYSVDAQEAIWAFKQTSKYRTMLQLIIVLGVLATVYVTHSAFARDPVPRYIPVVSEKPFTLEEQSQAALEARLLKQKAEPPDIPLNVKMMSAESCSIDGLKRVCRRLVVHRGPDTNTAVYLPIGHNLTLTVAHLFPERGDFLVTQTLAHGRSYKDGAPYHLPKRNVEHPESDFALVRDTHVVVYDKSVVVRALPKATREAWMVLFDKDGGLRTEKVLAIAVKEENVKRDGWKNSVAQCYKVLMPTQYGMCGSPLIVRDDSRSQWVVFATLMGSDSVSMSVFQAVTPRVEAAIQLRLDSWPDGPSLQALELVSARLPVKVVPAELHEKSALAWAPLSAVFVVGRQVPERSSTPKCEMVHTSFHDVVEVEFGKKDEFMKPEWRPKMWPGVDYPTGMMTQHIEVLSQCHDGLAAHRNECDIVFDEFKSIFSYLPHARTLSTREALNGVPGAIKGVNRKTSIGGWGRTGPKTAVLLSSTCPHYPNGVDIPPVFHARVAAIEEQWAAGMSVPPTCRIIPKMNEVRKKPVARQINVVELEWIIAARKLLEPIHEAMRKNERYASMIGRSPISKEWANQDARMRGVNPDVGVDADGVNADKVHGGTAHEYTRKMYVHVGAEIGYTPRELRMLNQLVEDMANSWQCYMGEVFVALFGIISGVPGTGDYQTAIFWFLLRVALVIMYGREVLSEANLASIHGGDDMKFAIAKTFAYSGLAFQQTMLELGYKFTSDTDKTQPPNAVPHEDTTFYKRRFLRDGGRVLAPLVESSVRKMLMWRDGGAKVPARQQEGEILRTAVAESFLLGREAYPRAVERIKRIGASAGYHVTIPDWDQLASEFDAGTLKTWHYEPELTFGTLCDCDRVISMVSGVETNTTVEAISKPQLLDVVDAGATDDQSAAPRIMALPLLREVSDALSRPIIVGETTWTSGLSTNIFPLSGLLANAVLGRNLNYFIGHRAVLCVKVSVVAPPMACGAILASLYANNTVDAFSTSDLWTPAAIMTHDCSTLIDIAVGNTAILRKQTPRWTDATFTYTTDALRGLHTLRLALAELIPVSYATATAAGNPTIYTWAWLEDAEQLGPTPIAQVAGRVDEWLPRYSSRLAKFAMSAATVAGGVVHAGHALTSAMIAAGFAFVAQLPEVTWVRERHGPFYATAEGVDSSVRLTLAPKALTIDNQAIMRGTKVDHLSFKAILSRPSFMGVVDWPQSYTAHTRVFTVPVHPCVGGAQGTPLSWLSTMFRSWTGSLKVTVYISCPSTVRGSLIFVYTPNSTALFPAYADITQAQPVVVDVAGSTSVEFDIPWTQEAATLPCTAPGAVAFPTTSSGTGFATKFNGYLTAYVQQPLITSGATAFTTRLVFTVKPGDDFAFLDPNLDIATRINLVSASLSTPLFQVETRHVSHRFSGTRRTPEQLATINGGEIITTLRDLVKRKSVHYTQRFTPALVANAVAVDLPWFTTGLSTLQTASTTDAFQVLPCFLSQAALPFAAWSGSVRHTVTLVAAELNNTSTSTQGHPITLIVSRMPSGLTTAAHAVWAFTGVLGTQLFSFLGLGNGTDVTTTSTYLNSVSVEAPFIANQFALPVPNNFSAGGPCVRVGLVNPSQTPEQIGIVDYVSAGDDFDLFEWIGVPAPLMATTLPQDLWSAI